MLRRYCFDDIKSLRSTDKIIITKPDKGSGVVILNKSDITKMNLILNDASKFQLIGPVDTNKNTAKIEAKIQRRLLQLSNGGVMHESDYKEIHSTGSLRPRLYGLPKVHKKEVPLRPILSMVGPSQHALAKYLAAVIDPVLQLYSNNCIKHSFTFAKEMQDLQMHPKETFLCSFDIRSSFTTVPLAETIQICADSLYGGELIPPDYPKEIFVELMNTATKSVEFSYNNNMYKQIDGVAMGSLLSVALANIFVGYHESKLFESTIKPFLYHRYVNDTFAIFGSEDDCTSFLDALNPMHSALKFTLKKEENDQLPFLDVLVEKSNEGFLTSVFRKPTFTGQYFRWDSFGPTKRKTNLIETHVHQVLMISSKSKLQHELKKNISSIIRNNGYPESIIQITMSKKIALFNHKPKGPQKCPVYLKLPWIGKISLNFEKQTKIAIKRCYQAVDPRIIFTRKNFACNP